jgi:hypothetical protein
VVIRRLGLNGGYQPLPPIEWIADMRMTGHDNNRFTMSLLVEGRSRAEAKEAAVVKARALGYTALSENVLIHVADRTPDNIERYRRQRSSNAPALPATAPVTPAGVVVVEPPFEKAFFTFSKNRTDVAAKMEEIVYDTAAC